MKRIANKTSIFKKLSISWLILKHRIFPGKAVMHALSFFKPSSLEVPVDCSNVKYGLPPLAEGEILVRDLWGRNLIVNIVDKKAYPLPVKNPFAKEEENEKIVEDLQEDTIVYKKILELDNKVWRKVKHKIKDLDIEEPLEIAREIVRYRKEFSNVYGQAPMLPIANAIRVAFIEKYLPKGARILHIGDNDALSIILAKRGYLPTVIDVDKFVCWNLRALAKRFNAEVPVKLIDVREPFSLEQEFDAFVTDPEHTVACLIVFVLRGLQFVKIGGYGFVTWENNFFQRRYFNVILKQFYLRKLKLIKKLLYYVSPFKTFYEHMKSFNQEHIGFSIPKWKGDLWILQKEKNIDTYHDKEFTISMY
ncbi:MAG: bis-aminopropyl spermidine synthase family protein [Candidatus Odinarchaeota archaeon]|nr:bis-aminopropyl spermidine synthase family protein [Candidatus Odinarchaeota archaeon]